MDVETIVNRHVVEIQTANYTVNITGCRNLWEHIHTHTYINPVNNKFLLY